MDVNGSRFHLLLTRDDWGTALAGDTSLAEAWNASPPDDARAGFSWNDERSALTLARLTPRFVAAPGDSPPDPESRRGAACDAFGNIYWIDASRQAIRVVSAGSGRPSRYWPDDRPRPCGPVSVFGPVEVPSHPLRELAGLAVTEDHRLVVGTLDPAGLLVFDLHAVGEPLALEWPREIPFAPYDLAPRKGGGLVVLDRAHRRYWLLDRHLAVEPGQGEIMLAPERIDAFQPVDGDERGEAERRFAQGLALDQGSPIDLGDVVAVEVMGDDTVLVLEADDGSGFGRVAAYRDGLPLGDPVSLVLFAGELEEDARAGFRLVGYDMALQPDPDDPRRGRLLVVSAEGNQTFAMEATVDDQGLDLRASREFLPMRRFGGKGLAAGGGRVFYDFAQTWVPLTAQPIARYAREASLETMPLDSRLPGCVWHRLLLDGCLPPGTEVKIATRAADDVELLTTADWFDEPVPYRRGDGRELPWSDPRDVDPGAGTFELLFQQARGRYLQIRLTLLGNERASPRINALRAWYPRFSYLQEYLPAIYRAEPQSASLMDRLLANFEGTETTIEGRIAMAQALFDVRSAPRETLDWLAGWFGVALDPAWDERRRRLFIRHAMTFFRWRGTVHGLRMALSLALDECIDESELSEPHDAAARPHDIRIIERFMQRRFTALSLGDPLELAGPRTVIAEPRWTPAQGGARLHQLYAEATGGTASEFPLSPPAEAAAAWRSFCTVTLGFIPELAAGNRVVVKQWQDFLARRYRRIRALNDAYGASWASFDAITPPARLPADGAALIDWHTFEATVLAMRRNAHRFSALAPAPRPRADRARARSRLDLAKRIIELEKPAHTTFGVGLYWALFRVGEARLGLDTVLEEGSRAPDLLPPIVLGLDYVGEGILDHTLPPDRQVLECA